MGECALTPAFYFTTFPPASEEQLTFNKPHVPHPNALSAYHTVQHQIKAALVKSRHDWNKHEPRMWARTAHLSDDQLAGFHLEKDLVLVSSAVASYGTIILGKIRIPAVNDDLGEGFIHVRCVHPKTKKKRWELIFSSRIHDPPKGASHLVICFVFPVLNANFFLHLSWHCRALKMSCSILYSMTLAREMLKVTLPIGRPSRPRKLL
jgi:hypothetical protein